MPGRGFNYIFDWRDLALAGGSVAVVGVYIYDPFAGAAFFGLMLLGLWCGDRIIRGR